MDEIQTLKLDDNTLRVVRATPVATDYTRDDLETLRAAVFAARDREYASRTVEMAALDDLIAKCDALGIVSETE